MDGCSSLINTRLYCQFLPVKIFSEDLTIHARGQMVVVNKCFSESQEDGLLEFSLISHQGRNHK